MARVDPSTDPLNDQMYEGLRLTDFLRHFSGQVTKVEAEATGMSTAGPFLDEDTPTVVKKSRQQRRAEAKKATKDAMKEQKKATKNK